MNFEIVENGKRNIPLVHAARDVHCLQIEQIFELRSLSLERCRRDGTARDGDRKVHQPVHLRSERLADRLQIQQIHIAGFAFQRVARLALHELGAQGNSRGVEGQLAQGDLRGFAFCLRRGFDDRTDEVQMRFPELERDLWYIDAKVGVRVGQPMHLQLEAGVHGRLLHRPALLQADNRAKRCHLQAGKLQMSGAAQLVGGQLQVRTKMRPKIRAARNLRRNRLPGDVQMHVDFFYHQRRALSDTQVYFACLDLGRQVGRRLLNLRENSAHARIGLLQRERLGLCLRRGCLGGLRFVQMHLDLRCDDPHSVWIDIAE